MTKGTRSHFRRLERGAELRLISSAGSAIKNCSFCEHAIEMTNRKGGQYFRCGSLRMLAANAKNQARLQAKVYTLRFHCPLWATTNEIRWKRSPK